MRNLKSVSTPYASHFKLNSEQCPTREEDKEDMKTVPYASAVGSLMYVMVHIIFDIAYLVGMFS